MGWDPVNRFNHTSWVAVVTPTDRPKSVGNRCVIEVLVACLCCQVAFFDFAVPVGGFCHRTESDLFLFLLQSSQMKRFKTHRRKSTLHLSSILHTDA